jgi:hypothetical protein
MLGGMSKTGGRHARLTRFGRECELGALLAPLSTCAIS